MSYRSILVNLDLDGQVIPITRLAIDFAKRFDARLVGFCAGDAPLPAIMAPEGGAIAIDIREQMRADIKQRFGELHAEFDKQVAGAIETEWREVVDTPSRALSWAARTADLIVTGATSGDTFRTVDPGSIVLQAGRPLLVAASGAEQVAAQKIVLAWKDTREARRAIADALPTLFAASDVYLVAVHTAAGDRTQAGVEDVVSFLAAHGIKAETEVLTGADEVYRLTEFIASVRADLVVSGAYGHSRLSEWVFGGVTRSLLEETGLNRLMSN